MNFFMWTVVWFGFGVALGAAANKTGLWDMIIRHWNEDVPERQPTDFKPPPLKFRRLPPRAEPPTAHGRRPGYWVCTPTKQRDSSTLKIAETACIIAMAQLLW
jgi:hypothetical protein